MNLNWLESLLYGLISGLSEFLPISTQAHQRIYLHILGNDQNDPVRDLFVCMALVLSVYTACRSLVEQIRRELKYRNYSRNGRRHSFNRVSDYRMIQNITVPMVLAMFLISFFFRFTGNLLLICIVLFVNGLVIFASGRTLQGNKNARSMSVLDSAFIGILGALSVIPGFSRVGLTTSGAIFRGADKQNAFNWSLLISVPALCAMVVVNLISAFGMGGDINLWSNFLTYMLSAIGAYIGGYLSILLMRLIISSFDLNGFAFYSWGAALFTFIIYLTVV